jgi:hypothetical protein
MFGGEVIKTPVYRLQADLCRPGFFFSSDSLSSLAEVFASIMTTVTGVKLSWTQGRLSSKKATSGDRRQTIVNPQTNQRYLPYSMSTARLRRAISLDNWNSNSGKRVSKDGSPSREHAESASSTHWARKVPTLKYHMRCMKHWLNAIPRSAHGCPGCGLYSGEARHLDD